MSDRLHQEWQRSRDSGDPLTVVLLDVDHFKAINDRQGHGRGDLVIAQVGQVLRATVRRDDCVARWGGEEFLVLLPGATIEAARETAERIRKAVAQQILRDEDDAVPLTVTVGVADWRSDESLDHTIDRADRALYRGKQAGRNRVVIAGVDETDDRELFQQAS
jgi:diguanylate cyclase (GGDEF)-like protein